MARRISMSAYLYYRCSAPILSDAEYDEMCEVVASRWGELSPLRQWQFESAETLRATGHHTKVTFAGVSGAIGWYKSKYKVWLPPVLNYPLDYKWSEEFKVHWIYAEG